MSLPDVSGNAAGQNRAGERRSKGAVKRRMDNRAENNVLYVKLFGAFSMIWNGRQGAGASKSSETQFAYLMQMLLHNGVKGVSRSDLEENLFGDREVLDPHHSMRSVIYNAKKKLKAAGLPDVNYIRQSDGVYYWTEEIKTKADTWEMESCYKMAETEEDPEKRLRLYLDACHCYTGEFLGIQASSVWAAQEARRYRELFCACVENAAQLYREAQDFTGLEQLGLYAAKISPLEDWETITMEALVSQGRFAEAKSFYDETVEFYMAEQGLRPSGRLYELLEKLGAQMQHHYAVLDDIEAMLSKEGDGVAGGYLCTYPVFQGIYQMIKRMMERNGQAVFLMLCTVVDAKGDPVKEGPLLEELSERLGDAIRQSVRRSDIISRYGSGQYLTLLVNITRENCEMLQGRIRCHFAAGRKRAEVRYSVNSVACTPYQEKKV